MLFQDHHDLLSAFLLEKVKFLVVGAVAMAAYSVPRATGDLDVWVNPTGENAGRVIQALIRFSAPMDQITRDDFRTPDRVVQIGLPPVRVDIMTSIDGVEFRSAYPGRLKVDLDGLLLPVISREDLIRNKTAMGGLQDLADLDRLAAFAAEVPSTDRQKRNRKGTK